MKVIKVSILVLTYNHEKYIRQALDSILCQKTDFDFEILVGDDASTDNTPAILQEYSKTSDNLHILFRESNIGATANFVELLEKAQGKYIASCEGDDYWTDPYKLQKQIDFLEKNPNYIGCTHNITLVDENGVPRSVQKLNWVKDKPVYSFKDFKGIYLPGHPVSLVYRNIFREDTEAAQFILSVHRNIADRTTAMLLAARGNIARINDNMACYRQVLKKDEKSLTSNEFAANPYSKLTDMKITNKLEEYANTRLGRHVSFDLFRCNLLLRTLAKAFVCASKERFDCFVLLIKEWKLYRKRLKNQIKERKKEL